MNFQPKALITGVAGQDGSYLAELLVSRGYHVSGLELRQVANTDFENLSNVRANIEIHYGDLTDQSFVNGLISQIAPSEIYHLAAMSFVSFDPKDEEKTLANNIFGTHNVLFAMREFAPRSKLFFAGSAELFGNTNETPQSIATPFSPRSIYGISKLTGFHLVKYYREKHGLFCSTGILYNHESPRRGINFVTRKIARAAARIKLGMETELILGNLDSQRDWGSAKDFVFGYWKQLQLERPTDLIFATGKKSTVRQLVEIAFDHVGLDYQSYVRVSQEYFQPTEEFPLIGSVDETKSLLGWENTTSLEAIIVDMVEAELARATVSEK